MELDDLKRSWEEYDKKLAENLKVNEELLRRSTLDRSRRALNTPLVYESMGLFFGFILFLFFMRWTLLYGREWQYLICGGISLSYILFHFVCGIKKVGMLLRLNYYDTPVLDLQMQLSMFNTFYSKVRKIDLCTMAFALLAMVPIGVRAIHGYDILQSHPRLFVMTGLIMLVLAYPMMIWIYRNWYDKKIKAARQFFSELQEFEKV